MTGRDVVREVICLLNGGGRWVKGSYGKTGEGYTIDSPADTKAARFCLLGAAHRVLGLDSFKNVKDHEALCEFSERIRDSLPKKTRVEYREKGHVTANENPGDYVVTFNDNTETTFNDIERVLAKALVRKSPKRTKKSQPTA